MPNAPDTGQKIAIQAWPAIHDVLTKVGQTGLLAALAAGLAAVALYSGTARLARKSLPEGFPADTEAAQAKYELAYRQLEEATGNNPQGIDELISALKGQPAAQLSLQAFSEAKSYKVSARPRSARTNEDKQDKGDSTKSDSRRGPGRP